MLTALIEPLMLAILILSPTGDGTNQRVAACLPADVQQEEVVSTTWAKPSAKSAKPVTVGQTLVRLKARCKKGKLIAGAGREIRFYRLLGCWGNPPDDYQEQLARQGEELQRLKQKFVVVEIPCGTADPTEIH